MKFKIKIKKILNIIILLLISYVIYVTIDIYLYANTNEITKSDAAIVLGAGVWGNKPSPVFEERIRHGIWLYRNGYVKKLIFTGGTGKNNVRSDSSIAKSYAVENLVPKEGVYKIYLTQYFGKLSWCLQFKHPFHITA